MSESESEEDVFQVGEVYHNYRLVRLLFAQSNAWFYLVQDATNEDRHMIMRAEYEADVDSTDFEDEIAILTQEAAMPTITPQDEEAIDMLLNMLDKPEGAEAALAGGNGGGDSTAGGFGGGGGGGGGGFGGAIQPAGNPMDSQYYGVTSKNAMAKPYVPKSVEALKLEYAKSARAACRQCKSKIDMNALRVVVSGDPGNGFRYTHNYHVTCFKFADGASEEDVFGLEALTSADRAYMLDRLSA